MVLATLRNQTKKSGCVSLTCLLFLSLLLSTQHSYADKVYTLKFATLLPTGTRWTKTFDDWIHDVETRSNGRIKFKMYAGGVMGDEPDVLRKIRKGQLHGGLFSGYGIGRIYSPARILELPFLFKDTDESDYVREKLMPDINAGFRENGFELIGWPEVGFIHFFSKHKIQSIADIKKSRIWLWQGDPLGESLFEAADIKPVPLSIIDVYPQLAAKHGSIDTVYMSTLGAIALQWYAEVSYATHISVTNAIGAVVISNKFFDRLPGDLKQLLRQSGIKASDRIREQTREENIRSKQLLIENGIEFVWDWDTVDMNEFLKIRDAAARHLIETDYFPQQFFDKTRHYLDEYRNSAVQQSAP